LLVFFLVTQVDDLAEAFAPNVRKVVPFDDLAVLALSDNEKKVEAAFLTIDDLDFVVAPLVVGVFVHRIALFVEYVDDLYATQPTLEEEGEFNRVVSRERHQISDVLVQRVGVFDLVGLLEALWIRPV